MTKPWISREAAEALDELEDAAFYATEWAREKYGYTHDRVRELASAIRHALRAAKAREDGAVPGEVHIQGNPDPETAAALARVAQIAYRNTRADTIVERLMNDYTIMREDGVWVSIRERDLRKVIAAAMHPLPKETP